MEGSELSVRQTLAELDVNRGTFYEWYERYREGGYDALATRKPQARRFTEPDPGGGAKAGGKDRPGAA